MDIPAFLLAKNRAPWQPGPSIAQAVHPERARWLHPAQRALTEEAVRLSVVADRNLNDEAAFVAANKAINRAFAGPTPEELAAPVEPAKAPVKRQDRGEVLLMARKLGARRMAGAAVRPGSKQDALLKLLERGATMEELLASCGWKSCRGAIGEIARKVGKQLVKEGGRFSVR